MALVTMCFVNACKEDLRNAILAAELPGSSSKLEHLSYKSEQANVYLK